MSILTEKYPKIDLKFELDTDSGYENPVQNLLKNDPQKHVNVTTTIVIFHVHANTSYLTLNQKFICRVRCDDQKPAWKNHEKHQKWSF